MGHLEFGVQSLSIPIAGMFGRGGLVNHLQFAKLKPSKLVVTTNK